MAIVLHFPDSTMTEQEYNQIASLLEDRGLGNPIGREYHLAYNGPDGNIKVLDVWDSQENLGKFFAQLMPLLEEAGATPGAPNIFRVTNIKVGE